MTYLVSKKFDTIIFQISGLLCLLLLLPYEFWGAAVVIPIYNIYLIFFGLPHNYMTWATIFPKRTRRTFALKSAVLYPAIFCMLICLTLPFITGTERNFVLTIITLASLWHSYRQHHGICKLYDAVQAKRLKDPSIFADRKWLDRFFFLGAWAIVVWAYTHPEIKYLLSDDEYYMIMYPQIPYTAFIIYSIVTVLTGAIAFKKVVYDRWKRGAFIPWPQINLMLVALATYILPYTVIPIGAMPLAVAIATMYHNIQYFGFVWTFERIRGEDLHQKAPNKPLPISIKTATRGKWLTWFAMAMTYSFAIVGIYLLSPQSFGLFLIYYVAFAHYIIDGFIWRRKNNVYVGHFVNHLAHTEFNVAGDLIQTPSSITTNPQTAAKL